MCCCLADGIYLHLKHRKPPHRRPLSAEPACSVGPFSTTISAPPLILKLKLTCSKRLALCKGEVIK